MWCGYLLVMWYFHHSTAMKLWALDFPSLLDIQLNLIDQQKLGSLMHVATSQERERVKISLWLIIILMIGLISLRYWAPNYLRHTPHQSNSDLSRRWPSLAWLNGLKKGKAHTCAQYCSFLKKYLRCSTLFLKWAPLMIVEDEGVAALEYEIFLKGHWLKPMADRYVSWDDVIFLNIKKGWG